MSVDVRPVAISLFSGAGGLDIGIHQAGFRIGACVEVEPSFCETLQLNVGHHLDPSCRIMNRDITSFDPTEIGLGSIDFIIGGPPCQSFSAIGRRAGGIDGTNSIRGSLFEHYCRIVRHIQPKGFLFENVRGILGSNKGRDWELILEAFSELGYTLSYRVLDCADYGVPQHRERLIMVGLRDGATFQFPRPTHGPDSSSQRPHVSALEAIVDLQDPDEPDGIYTGKYGHLLAEVPPGTNYHYFTKEMGYPNPIFAWRSRFSDFLYKADPEKPVRTIVAHLGKYSGPFHWKNRKFTLDEFKRLQTFPDNYQFAGGLTGAMKQIGNSVPPAMAQVLGRSILQQVFDIDHGLELLGDDERLSFDGRKSRKARATRVKRVSGNTDLRDLPLFQSLTVASQKEPTAIAYCFDRLYAYPTMRHRVAVDTPLPDAASSARTFQIHTQRDGPIAVITVTEHEVNDILPAEMFRYTLRFKHPIGDGLTTIMATLVSSRDDAVAVVWDAIEDQLSHCSGYETMIDVYGHFTEPHPIFRMTLDVCTPSPSFVLRFAEAFSHFKETTKVLPASVLEEMHQAGSASSFNLQDVVIQLRELRFDIRVNETNATIPPGHFRCCYPFTINVNRQISVKWRHHAATSKAH